MSPRAAWRLETLGFAQVYDYSAGKKDWFDAGLPMEGEIESAVFLGHRARRDLTTCRLHEQIREVAARAAAAGWDQAAVVNDSGILLGWLSAQALAQPESTAVEVMLEGPVTFRPSNSLADTRAWMDRKGERSVLVTSSDGSLIGAARREDVEETGEVGG